MSSTVGVVVTDEVTCLKTGPRKSGPKLYQHSCFSPLVFHQLCVINTACVPDSAFSLLPQISPDKYDWLFKTSAALSKGALHLKLVGYVATSTEGSMSKVSSSDSADFVTSFLQTLPFATKGRVPTKVT